ncbi:hypothetical protein DI09_68p100 [Mitosporidium daphniae]|uniref:SAM-dependent MTase RsmB/NOP-type domain-containing protein n=1 Tax=Mitosporidium daphniae TaxID=1485682 RepID=A0A098VN49_9MICR|nr:uncharacterized protein DI09_68p100 [Mitosporidium daphniae]KGG50502.1 hypothetical protein DI09_68p100 [Mitosporidium daphniae]|eukprot:XP_013236929.1 uncharacterized protein DI09_68p100 [Mitosporidium daphniae]
MTGPLPAFFLDFLSRNNLSSAPYFHEVLANIPRSFTINSLCQDTCEESILKHFPDAKKYHLSDSLAWFEMDPSINIGSSLPFKQGKIFSMDFPSIFAIWILDIQAHDHVLDMCCAPGLKLSLAASIIGTSGVGSVTGIDISAHRLRDATSLVKKIKVPKCRLFKGDSTNVLAEKIGIAIPENQLCKPDNFIAKEFHLQVKKPFYSTSQYRKRRCYYQEVPAYDKIILDAQCTHDGSIKHVLKSLSPCGANTNPQPYWTDVNETNTIETQKSLLKSAFSLLRVGGMLVYCTCSRTQAQNENVIKDFLAQEKSAFLLPVPYVYQLKDLHPVHLVEIVEGAACAIRFEPESSRSNGFFICLMSKN